MNTQDKISSLISSYLSGSLNTQDIEKVEQLLKTDDAYQREYDNQRTAHRLIIEASLADIDKSVRAQVQKKEQIRKYKIIGSIIAVAATVIGVTLFCFENNNSKTAPKQNEVKTKASIIEQSEESKTIATTKLIDHKLTKKVKPAISTRLIDTPTQSNIVITTQNIHNTENKITNSLHHKLDSTTTKGQFKENNTNEENTNLLQPTLTATNTPTVDTTKCAIDISKIKVLTKPATPTGLGEIIISSPYDISFTLNKTGEYSTNGFEDLEAGKYLINYNEQNCEINIPISIKEEFCLSQKDYTINKNYGENFTVDIPTNASVLIINKYQETILNQQIRDNSQFIWDGTNQFGQLLSLDLYKIIVQFDNGKRCIYNVTIME